jgi:hypothetical protein
MNEESRFGSISNKIEDNIVWVDAIGLVMHLNSVAWVAYNDGAVDDAGVIAVIGKWLESCSVNAFVDSVIDAAVLDGPEAATDILMSLLSDKRHTDKA